MELSIYFRMLIKKTLVEQTHEQRKFKGKLVILRYQAVIGRQLEKASVCCFVCCWQHQMYCQGFCQVCLWLRGGGGCHTILSFILTLATLNYFSINHEDQFCFSIWNHHKCVSSFWFIWIPMFWVYIRYKCFTLLVRESTLDVRIWRL